MSDLAQKIVESVKKAQQQKIVFETIHSADTTVKKNEFLFFIKPEMTMPVDSIKFDKVVDVVMKKIDQFGLSIHNVRVLGAEYLDKHNIIAQHYGVINKIASDAKNSLGDNAKEKFKEVFGLEFKDATVLGGIEFLKKYPQFNAFSADILWQNKKSAKLAGGTYAIDVKVDNETVYVVNGFHPRQLEQFTAPGRSIVVMTLSSDLSWADARNKFIGATNPAAAEAGSLRREFLDKQAELGLPEVAQGLNGVHLSAGPVEGLLELRRYNSNFADAAKVKSFDAFSFGKKLQTSFDKAVFDKIIANENATVDGKSVSIFDLTEEKDSDAAIEILKKYV